MDGETSPLLSTPTPTIHGSDTDSYNPRDSRASLSFLIPIAIAAGLCNALTVYSRNVFFRQLFCEELGQVPDTPDPSLQTYTTGLIRLDCSSSPYPSGILTINVASILVTCVLSSLTTGWWSAFGDMHGRRYPLIASILGSVILNLVFYVIASNPGLESLAQPCVFAGLVLEALLGGSATFNGALHAYAADVSPAGSWSTVFSVFQGLLVLCNVLGNPIGFGTDFIKPFLSFTLALAIGILNLAFVFFFLPESLPEGDDPPSKVDVKKSIYSTVTVFFTTNYRLASFGLACFFYSLTSSLESFQLLFVLRWDPAMPFSAYLFMTLSLLFKVAAFLIVFPAMVHIFKRQSPLSPSTSTKQYLSSVIAIDGSAARYSVSANLLSQLLIVIIPTTLPMMFLLLALMTPLTAGIKPALYALTSVYSEAHRGASRRGVLFGALSVITTVAETFSYLMYVSTYSVLWRSLAKAGFMLTVALLALVAIFLWPGGELELSSLRDGPERIRIVVSEDIMGHDNDAPMFSPVYRRHSVVTHSSTDGS